MYTYIYIYIYIYIWVFYTYLYIHMAKTQCSILFSARFVYIKGMLLGINDSLTGAFFWDHVKYLGIYIGPGAHNVAWDDVTTKCSDCVRFLCSIDAGFVPTIYLYNILCVSVASWIGSFVPPNSEILVLESKLLQRLSRGPWNVFPKHFFSSLNLRGCPLKFNLSPSTLMLPGFGTLVLLPNPSLEFIG